jgi:hypothetical protein
VNLNSSYSADGQEGNKPGAWRIVCAVSGVVSLIQIFMTAQPIGVDEPRYNALSTDEENPEYEREAAAPLSPSIPACE